MVQTVFCAVFLLEICLLLMLTICDKKHATNHGHGVVDHCQYLVLSFDAVQIVCVH